MDEPPPTGLRAEYNERFLCDKRFVAGGAECVAVHVLATIEFTSLGGDDYEARESAGWGRVYRGTITGLQFDWTTTNPDGSTMTGSWVFDEPMGSFSGSGEYAATDGSYVGTCAMRGAANEVPAVWFMPGACSAINLLR